MSKLKDFVHKIKAALNIEDAAIFHLLVAEVENYFLASPEESEAIEEISATFELWRDSAETEEERELILSWEKEFSKTVTVED